MGDEESAEAEGERSPGGFEAFVRRYTGLSAVTALTVAGCVLVVLVAAASVALPFFEVSRHKPVGKLTPRSSQPEPPQQAETPQPPQQAETPPPSPPPPVPADVPTADPVAPAPTPEPKPKPPPPEIPSFTSTWRKAERIWDAVEKAEPALTQKALNLLTAGEQVEAQTYFGILKEGIDPAMIPEQCGRLIGFGLRARVLCSAVQFARKSMDFATVARALWHEKTTPAELADMAAKWGLTHPLSRIQISNVVGGSMHWQAMTPEARDDFLNLGGKKWMAARAK